MYKRNLIQGSLTSTEVELEGGAGGARPPPPIWQISQPYSNQGVRFCPSHYCQPPGFKKLSTPLPELFVGTE